MKPLTKMPRCAAFIPGGLQCHLAMYHTEECVFEPYKPFTTYMEDGTIKTVNAEQKTEGQGTDGDEH